MIRMQSFWSNQIDALGAAGPLGVIVHLGAGDGSLTEALLRSGARRVILQEANPVFQPGLHKLGPVRKLAEHAAGQSPAHPVQLEASALAAAAGTAQLRVFNMARQSSLRAPTELLGVFPGLREMQSCEVETKPLADLLRDVPMRADLTHVLIIDTPGEEHEAIAQLATLPAHMQFQHVFLRAGQLPLYRGSQGAGALIQALMTQGYQITAETDEDADFPCFCLSLQQEDTAAETDVADNALQDENTALRKRLAQAERDYGLLSKDLADLQARYKDLLRAHDARGDLLGQLAARLIPLSTGPLSTDPLLAADPADGGPVAGPVTELSTEAPATTQPATPSPATLSAPGETP